MLQLRRQLYLPLKTLGANARGELGGENFYGDFSSKSYFFADEYAGHPTAAQLALDGV